jgi:ADP-heptose:LPS heptosyltransferase
MNNTRQSQAIDNLLTQKLTKLIWAWYKLFQAARKVVKKTYVKPRKSLTIKKRLSIVFHLLNMLQKDRFALLYSLNWMYRSSSLLGRCWKTTRFSKFLTQRALHHRSSVLQFFNTFLSGHNS